MIDLRPVTAEDSAEIGNRQSQEERIDFDDMVMTREKFSNLNAKEG